MLGKWSKSRFVRELGHSFVSTFYSTKIFIPILILQFSKLTGIETKNTDDKDAANNLETKFSQMNLLKGPSPRFGAQLAIKQGILYLFGGLVEDSNDRQFTHKDLYCLGKLLMVACIL